MMHRYKFFGKAFLYVFTLFLVYPSSPFIFKKFISFKEPAFVCPLRIEKELPIRSDVMGDGCFAAKRSGGGRRHRGLDIAGSVGQSVFAAKSGVAETAEVPRGMGKYVKISHFDGYLTIYGHLSSVTACNKRWVWQGQEIGKVGKSGNADHPQISPHLHFEIRKNGEPQDPLPHLTIYERVR